MAAVQPPFDVLVPSKINTAMLLNACRVAEVNKHHPGAIAYDPLNKLIPSGVDAGRIIYAWYRATTGELQS